MTTNTYAADRTALLIVDPYNDFMSEGGKLYDAIKETADASGMFGNLRKILPKARSAGIQVFIMPHHRSYADDFDNWQHINMFQKAGLPTRAFEVGTWGGAKRLFTRLEIDPHELSAEGVIRVLNPLIQLGAHTVLDRVLSAGQD
jgi:hypothetical protein